MRKNKINLLGLSLLTLSTSAFSMQFTSTINKLKLPLLMSVEQPPAIKYVPPGEMHVTARRMCGDGDVAHFKDKNPNFEFVPSEQEKLDVIVGYWVVEDGEPNVNPTKENWFPIAYSKVKIEGSLSAKSNIGEFHPFTHDNATDGLGIVRDELKKLHDVSLIRFENPKKYRTYASVISCVSPDDGHHMTEKGQGEFYPSPLDIVKSLDGIKSGSFNDKTSKIKIELKKNQGFEFTFGEEGDELSGDLFTTFQKIMNIHWEGYKDLDEYKNQKKLIDLAETFKGLSGDKISFCKKLGTKSDKKYSFELFTMNLSCKQLFKGNTLSDAFNAFFNPSELPDKDKFEINKNKLAERFLIAAGLETAQKKLDDPKKIIKTGCFPKPGQKPIERIVASYPLKFIEKTASNIKTYDLIANEYNHIHPETLFAIRDYNRYFGTEFLAIWGQIVPNQAIDLTAINKNYSILLDPKTTANPLTYSFGSVQLNINFKVRSVGGSCNGTIYC